MFALILWLDPDTVEKVIAPFLSEEEAEKYYVEKEYGLYSVVTLEVKVEENK